MLHFATLCEPQDLFNPVNVFKAQRRAAVDTSAPDHWRCSIVPPAQMAPGVVDEGTWPRFVILDGQQMLMQRDEWDGLKLRGTHYCMIPQRGFPIADRVRGDVPELDSDSDSDASSDGTATPRAAPASPIGNAADLDDDLPPGSPMQSVVSRLSSSFVSFDDADAMSIVTRSSKMSVDSYTSKMSVDTIRSAASDKTIRSKGSSTLGPNDFGKRAKAPLSDHPGERAAKRFHVMYERGRREAANTRKMRMNQRRDYYRQRRLAAEQAEFHRNLADEALARENLRMAELHALELEEKRRKLIQLDAEERLERERHSRLERDRKEAAIAYASRRMTPYALPPKEAFELWLQRVETFQRLRRVKGPLYIRDIPFPVLFRPEYSLHLVTEENVATFFTACAGFMTPDRLKSARVVLHPDHFIGRQYIAGDNYEDEAQTAFVVNVMKVVSAYVNDNFGRN